MDAIQSNVIDLSLKYRITFCTQSAILFLNTVVRTISFSSTELHQPQLRQNKIFHFLKKNCTLSTENYTKKGNLR